MSGSSGLSISFSSSSTSSGENRNYCPPAQRRRQQPQEHRHQHQPTQRRHWDDDNDRNYRGGGEVLREKRVMESRSCSVSVAELNLDGFLDSSIIQRVRFQYFPKVDKLEKLYAKIRSATPPEGFTSNKVKKDSHGPKGLKVAYLLGMIFLLVCFGDWPHQTYARRIDDPVLKVGEELQEESMPLHGGSRIYKLEGLKPYTLYEVKISYPASVPAYFSIQLWKGDAELGASSNRKLLNTEKLIFRTDGPESLQNQGAVKVMVTVEPEGVVAIPGVKERQSIIFNIVCDELVLGIPHKAWWVVGCAVLCLTAAFVAPRFLPSFLLSEGPSPGSPREDNSKRS
ncbi:hypothetical protein MLD38_036054 [Melastoma candidum]|uniref:Uncharacterized protein n=1 Tax=Melastoma candidum TaxID=119954 RepID=A0ACB9LKC7_9MYRT|nr:hypothetical protein MLD38_036054 [Melastoma candidum]